MQSICCLCSTLIHLPAEISLLISKNSLFKAWHHLRKICSFTCSLFLMPTVLVHSCWMSCTLFHSNKNPILRDNLWLQCFVIWVVNHAGHHFTYRWKPKEMWPNSLNMTTYALDAFFSIGVLVLFVDWYLPCLEGALWLH